jgi:hypothetical protein
MDVREKMKHHMDKDLKFEPPKSFIQVNPATIKYEVDPIQDKRIKDKMSKNPEYARIMSVNESKLFYEWILKKIQLKENILIEIKGYPRSGKSITAITLAKLISQIVGKKFIQHQICKNESEYYQKLRIWNKLGKSFNSAWVVDEQVETHVSVGAYSEMSMIEDLNNIIAIECVHTIWVHPPHFVGRNALVGLETFGRNFEHKITRCIMYDLHENKKTGIPMGLVYIPIFRDKSFEEDYIEKKWDQVDGLIKGEDISGRTQARFRIAKALNTLEVFQEAKNNQIRLAIARKYCPFGLPDTAIKEIMALAKLPPEQLEMIIEMEKDSDLSNINLDDLGFGDETYGN